MKNLIASLLGAAVVLTALPFSSYAQEAEEPSLAPHKQRLMQETIVALRYNPLGLAVKSRAEYQYKLYESEKRIFERNYIAPGLFLDFTPANIKVGPTLAVQPLTILGLSAGYYFLNYFGTMDRMQSFTSLDENFSDDQQKENESYSASGTVLRLGAKFEIKVKEFAFRSTNRAMKFSLDTKDEDPLFYESELDLLVEADGWAYQVDNDFLYITDFGLIAGVRHTYATAFYSDAVPGDKDGAGVNHRAGPFFAYRFHTDPLEERTFYNEPTLVLLVNWYLEHTYRAGEKAGRDGTSSQAMPYIALAFRFTGDIIDID
ncbi:MAG: hypothetical protein HOI23_18190 [Deltaproteobacteria bacterium]|jgi:hypothetical protein|nr:hypothetical protein [Deltaproteobacteria bacterium]